MREWSPRIGLRVASSFDPNQSVDEVPLYALAVANCHGRLPVREDCAKPGNAPDRQRCETARRLPSFGICLHNVIPDVQRRSVAGAACGTKGTPGEECADFPLFYGRFLKRQGPPGASVRSACCVRFRMLGVTEPGAWTVPFMVTCGVRVRTIAGEISVALTS